MRPVDSVNGDTGVVVLDTGDVSENGNLREIIGENEVLNAIVETEKEHVRQVKRYLLTNSKFRGLGEKAIEYAV